MDPAQCLRCPEPGCRTILIGDDREELMEFMYDHQDSKHRKRFEDTKLGRLPIEVLVKIFSYVTPECKRCFRQSELLKLRSVCKKMRELTKLPDFYKEIKLGSDLCALPPQWIFESIIKRSGAQLKKISCDWENRTFLYHALRKRGGIIQKICIEGIVGEDLRVGNTWHDATGLEITGTQIASILKYVNGLNPRALTNIQFGTSDLIWISFDLAEDPGIYALAKNNRRKYPLFSRIVSLNLMRVGQHLAQHLAQANHAMRCITSLNRVTFRCSMPFLGSEDKLIRQIKDRIEEHDFISLDDISLSLRWKCYRINIVLCRKGEPPSLDPRLGFETFLKGMRKLKDPL